MRWEGLESRVNGDPVFVRFARQAGFRLLLSVGAQDRLMDVRDARLAAIERGPFVMPRCDFALRAEAAAWARFAKRPCAPRDQDLFAFFRRQEILLTGDTRMFYAHLMPVKLLLAHLGDEA